MMPDPIDLYEGHFDDPIVAAGEPLLQAGWRVAKSLNVLLAEINAMAPNRTKGYDGTIGDASHQRRASRHNPNRYGVVTARDITHDPAHGMDIHKVVRDYIARGQIHPELAYIISNRQVTSRAKGWTWRAYTGSSAHDHHAHFAVGVGPDSNPMPPYDSEQPWNIAGKPEEDPTVNVPVDQPSTTLAADAQTKLMADGILKEQHDLTKAAGNQFLLIMIERLLARVKALEAK